MTRQIELITSIRYSNIMADKVIQQSFDVRFTYPVVFTRDMWSGENTSVRHVIGPACQGHPHPLMLIFIDSNVKSAIPDIEQRIAHYFSIRLPGLELSGKPVIVPGGEIIKSDRQWHDMLLDRMAESRIDRHSFVMIVGGGAVLDAVGYAASLVHRGVRTIRVPTTVLSQNDGGIGVKTAINDAFGKNFLGTFAPPFAVINDINYLTFLPDDEWRAGIAEAFKVAIIKDADFFRWLCSNSGDLATRNLEAMNDLVYRCASLHLKHIQSGGDPFEMGRARPLDFGHWSAHELEIMSDYSIGHGQAVAIGIMIDSLYAAHRQQLPTSAVDELYRALATCGFKLWHDLLGACDDAGRLKVFHGLDRFREHLGGQLSITLPDGIGNMNQASEISEALMSSVISELHDRQVVQTF